MAGSRAPKLDWISKQLSRVSDDVVLIGVRGMYASSNKRGVYDDALIWCQKSTGLIATYTANVDPSTHRKRIANLKKGIWRYKKGPHPWVKGYPAFRQAAPVTVIRDGSPSWEDTGMFGINIHSGSRSGSTSSLGCQTVKAHEWLDFQKLGYKLLDASKQSTFAYILIGKDDIS